MESNTKQFRKRNAILACLRQTETHPSAEMLFAMLQQENSDISLASVYRNLAYFKEYGQIISLGTVNGVERFDGRIDPHVHFACRCCGSVLDVPENCSMDDMIINTEAVFGCRVENANILLSGICENCL